MAASAAIGRGCCISGPRHTQFPGTMAPTAPPVEMKRCCDVDRCQICRCRQAGGLLNALGIDCNLARLFQQVKRAYGDENRCQVCRCGWVSGLLYALNINGIPGSLFQREGPLRLQLKRVV